MTEKTQIVFTGNSFKSVIEGFGEKAVECTPIIYRKELNIGLKIEVKEFNKLFLIEQDHNDPFRVYRTMRIISRLGVISAELVKSAFLATDRIKEVSALGFSPPLSNTIKRKELRKVMMEVVPEEITKIVIKEGRELSDNEKWILKNELLAETISYDDRLAKLGIKEPKEIRKEIENVEIKIASIYGRISSITESYFEYVFLDGELKNFVINRVISILLIEKLSFSDEVIVALGAFLVQTEYYNSLRGKTEEGSFADALFQNRINEVIVELIYWLSFEKDYSPDDAAKELDSVFNAMLELE
ncbi:MAG: hypothetical protein WC319_03455 [Candidatus Paceibacterota bacterium]